MNNEIKVEYPNGNTYTVTRGALYTVRGWNQRAYYKLVNVRGVIAILATVKLGKIQEVGVHQLIPYEQKQRRVVYWKNKGKY